MQPLPHASSRFTRLTLVALALFVLLAVVAFASRSGFGGSSDARPSPAYVSWAFSIFLVDRQGAIVLQKRHPEKYHSGGLWANTCCGHPRPGEATIEGARRRLFEEVGVRARLRLAFRSRYAVSFGNGLSENEIVNVYCGSLAGELRPDPSEVVDLASVPFERLLREAEREPSSYAYWLQHYLRNHRRELERALANGTPLS